jgi:hypothetical protein
MIEVWWKIVFKVGHFVLEITSSFHYGPIYLKKWLQYSKNITSLHYGPKSKLFDQNTAKRPFLTD